MLYLKSFTHQDNTKGTVPEDPSPKTQIEWLLLFIRGNLKSPPNMPPLSLPHNVTDALRLTKFADPMNATVSPAPKCATFFPTTTPIAKSLPPPPSLLSLVRLGSATYHAPTPPVISCPSSLAPAECPSEPRQVSLCDTCSLYSSHPPHPPARQTPPRPSVPRHPSRLHSKSHASSNYHFTTRFKL